MLTDEQGGKEESTTSTSRLANKDAQTKGTKPETAEHMLEKELAAHEAVSVEKNKGRKEALALEAQAKRSDSGEERKTGQRVEEERKGEEEEKEEEKGLLFGRGVGGRGSVRD